MYIKKLKLLIGLINKLNVDDDLERTACADLRKMIRDKNYWTRVARTQWDNLCCLDSAFWWSETDCGREVWSFLHAELVDTYGYAYVSRILGENGI